MSTTAPAPGDAFRYRGKDLQVLRIDEPGVLVARNEATGRDVHVGLADVTAREGGGWHVKALAEPRPEKASPAGEVTNG